MIYPFNEVLPLYKRVITEYEAEISQYGFELLQISETERVYNVQGKFAVYLGMVDFDTHLNGGEPTYMIVFEEFMKNTVFKFNFTGFKRKFTTNEGLKMEYKKFHGWGKPIREINDITLGNFQRFDSTYTAAKYLIPSKCEYINEMFPDLQLKETYENLEGNPYYYLVLRMVYNGKPGYAIKASNKKYNDKKISEAVHEALYEGLNYSWRLQGMDANVIGGDHDFSRVYYEAADKGQIVPRFNELFCDSHMVDSFFESIWNDEENAFVNNKKEEYLTVESYVACKNYREPEEAKQSIGSIFIKARSGAYDGFFTPQITFSADVCRAEHLIFKLLRTEYKDVYRSYAAPFLTVGKDQYVYDFYIKKKKVAIQYRARFCFEPIEEFGGEEKYIQLSKAQEIISELSAENKVKVAYIDYTDTISMELLRSRIENAGKNVKEEPVKIDGINVETAGKNIALPDSYQQLESMTEDPKYSSLFGSTTPSMQSFVMIYPIGNQNAMPYDEPDKVMHGIRDSLADDQGLVEVNAGKTIHGKKYIYTIVKSAKEPHGILYTLMLHIAYSDFSIAIQGFFDETGVTGMRDTTIYEILVRSNVVNPYDKDTWFKDPYLPYYKKGLLMNLSEQARYDEKFPDHPLSQLRSLVKFVIKNN